MASAVDSRLPTANRGSNNSYTTSWDTTETTLVAEFLNGFFESRDSTHWDAENVEEVAVEKLSLSFLIPLACPVFRESCGADADFVP